jgi:YHS domain-containing protein
MKNTNIIRRIAFSSLIVAVLAVSSTAMAQSNGHKMSKNMMDQKQNMQAQQQVEIGLEGYCPVCVVKNGKWVKGKAEHSATFDGVAYHFPSEDIRNMFQENPNAYVPALGGDCIVCLAKAGKRVPGNIRFAALKNDRLYLFPSDKELQAFNSSPDEFANADIAADGKCIVCKVKAGKVVDGSPQFTAIHDGLRYLFPSDRERQAFASSPAEFVNANSRMMDHSMMQKGDFMQKDSKEMMKSTSMIQIQGTTACAACEFGVTPINAPEELGLAVTTADGQIYVIEESHTRWPQLYKDRFEGKRVAVSGDVIKTKGNITWIKPSNLRTL